MAGFLYSIVLHWKLNFRSKEVLVHFYIVPLVFYLFIGNIFTSIDPTAYQTIIPAMIVFGVTMGGVLGSPYALVEYYGTEIKKAYQVAKVPIWTMAVCNLISAMIHLFLMSMVIILTGPILFKAPLPEHWGAFFLGLFLLLLSSLGIGTVYGLIFTNSSKMGMAGQLIFLPSIMLSGIMFSSSMLPEVMGQVGKLFPATWGFLAMTSDKLSITVLLPMIIVALITILFSGWRLRKLSAKQ